MNGIEPVQLPLAIENRLATGLHIDGEFPLAVSPTQPQSPLDSLDLLRAAVTLELQGTPAHDDVRAAANDSARLEAKVDLILALFGNWLRQHAIAPSATLCRLNNEGLLWRSSEACEPETPVSIDIFLNAAVPLPVRFPATISACIQQDDAFWLEARLHLQNNEVADYWGRWLFLRHRKTVAGHAERAGVK